MITVNKNDIIQITDESNEWFPCLLIVNEVKSWGVQAYMDMPKAQGQAYYRIEFGKFEVVGTANIVSS